MKKVISAIAWMFFLTFNSLTASAEALSIDAKAYILIDQKSGQVLVEHNANQQLYPASTTKIMTAILAIEKGDLNQLMTASATAVAQKANDKENINRGIGINGSNIGIVAGEQLRLEDLLNALLIKSANDAANVIAENIAPTWPEFIELMNKRAVELGAANTNFTNACGLDVQDGHPNHMTTASDLAKFARYAMTLPIFRQIVVKTKHTMPDTNKHPASYWPSDYLTTTNKLLLFSKYKSSSYQVTGMKTGYTINSDFNMVAGGKNEDGMELVSVVLGGKGTDSQYIYSKVLLDYGFSNFALQKVSDAGKKMETVSVLAAADNSTLNLVTEGEVKCTLPVDMNQWNIEEKRYVEPDIKAPVTKGDVLGYVEYMRNGMSIGKTNLIAESSVEKLAPPTLTLQNAKEVFSNHWIKKAFYGCIILLMVFFLLRQVLRRISREVRSRRQEN